jgi:hypothetical protein
VTNSSAQTTYYYTLEGDVVTSSSDNNIYIGSTTDMSEYCLTNSDTITLDINNMAAAQTVTLTSSGLDTITFDGTIITSNNWNWISNIPFENGFPDWDDFQKMCEEYPGLEQAYEKLKTFYNLCRDEWEFKKKGLK